MTYTLILNQEQINILIDQYQSYEVLSKTNYTLFRAKIKSSTLTVYSTNKVLIQGNDANQLYNEINALLNLELPPTEDLFSNQGNSPIKMIEEAVIGNDEVGCGDFFGPIVVCSALVDDENFLLVKKLKIKDSKELNDKQIINIAPILIEHIPHTVTILSNEKYNSIINNPNINLNKIKAILHNNVMNKFKFKYEQYKDNTIVLDDFCGEKKYFEYLNDSKVHVNKNIKFYEKAENQFYSVAVASIISRFYFLNEMDELSKLVNYDIPKGASKKVDDAAYYLYKKGINMKDICKINFKNYQKLLNRK